MLLLPHPPPSRLKHDAPEILKFYSPETFEKLKLVASSDPAKVIEGIEAFDATNRKLIDGFVKLTLSEEQKLKLKEGLLTLTLDTKKQGPLGWAQDKIDQFTALAREKGWLPPLKPKVEGPKPPTPPKPPAPPPRPPGR